MHESGFSFRFYTTELMKNDKLKLLSIDGIAPTKENIENGTNGSMAH